MRRHLATLFVCMSLLFTLPNAGYSQCAACKANVESAATDPRNTKGVGRGINNGILYLLALPYLAGAVIAVAWYRQRKRSQIA
jgi:hypothetical protein